MATRGAGRWIRDAGPTRNSLVAVCGGINSAGGMVAAGGLGKTGARRDTDGRGAAAALGSVGCAELAHTSRCAISGATLQRAARRIHSAWIHGMDEYLDVAVSR